MSSFRSRRLRENRQYHRTQVTIMTGSNWRFRNRGGRQDLMLSTYQISGCNTSHEKGKEQGSESQVAGGRMSLYLCLTVRFLDLYFHGRIDDGSPEWPPSPMRAFQSMIAVA